jgi:hypothetical protein
MHPPDVRPLLHPDHTPSSSPDHTIKRGSEPGRTTPAARRVGHFSPGAAGSVFRRHPHTGSRQRRGHARSANRSWLSRARAAPAGSWSARWYAAARGAEVLELNSCGGGSATGVVRCTAGRRRVQKLVVVHEALGRCQRLGVKRACAARRCRRVPSSRRICCCNMRAEEGLAPAIAEILARHGELSHSGLAIGEATADTAPEGRASRPIDRVARRAGRHPVNRRAPGAGRGASRRNGHLGDRGRHAAGVVGHRNVSASR